MRYRLASVIVAWSLLAFLVPVHVAALGTHPERKADRRDAPSWVKKGERGAEARKRIRHRVRAPELDSNFASQAALLTVGGALVIAGWRRRNT